MEKINTDDLVQHVEEYIDTQRELGKLIAVEKSTVMVSSIISSLIILSFFLVMLVFLSLALAYELSEYMGRVYAGFLCVGALYLVLGIIFYLKRNSWLQSPLTNAMIKNFFKDNENE
jgi:ABC-type uncharacterized transport system fused permease/ATPase subunit